MVILRVSVESKTAYNHCSIAGGLTADIVPRISILEEGHYDERSVIKDVGTEEFCRILWAIEHFIAYVCKLTENVGV
jgi:hypothetical protein